jgi:hypothetical protein
VGCLGDADCGGVTPSCSLASHTCVPCAADGAPSCPDPARPVCQRAGPLAGACTQCSTSNTAACGGLKPACLADGLCGCDPAASGACGVDSGLLCSGAGGFCVPGCNDHPGNGCPGGAACLDVSNGVGHCAGASCASDAACAAPLGRCDLSVTGGLCVQCLVDGDCGAGLVCDGAKHACVECAAGHAEACRADLAGARCSASGTCGCDVDADCGGATSGRVCDPATARCVPGCRGAGGNACPDAQPCSSTTDAIGSCNPASAGDGGADGSVGVDAADAGDAGVTSDARPDATADALADAPKTDASDARPDAVTTPDSGPDAGSKLGPDGYLAGGGCHCEASGARGPSSRAGLGWLLILGLAVLRRRRARK